VLPDGQLLAIVRQIDHPKNQSGGVSMIHPRLIRLAAPLLALALAQGPALAQATAGSAGSDNGAGSGGTSPAGGAAPPSLSQSGTTRDIATDTLPALSALTTLGKTADGKTTSTPPSDALAVALKGMTTPPPSGSAESGGAAKPAPVVPVKKSDVYPYRAVGQVEVTYGKNKYYCTGVLIGPATVATAAGCLWGAENNPVWTDHVAFYPAINGNTAPYAPVEWAGAFLQQGFVDASTAATSDGPLPYAIGLVTLAQPIGDKLGYFGFQTDVNKSYKGNVITYGTGDQLHDMGTTTCPVDASTMYRSFAFAAPCAASGYGSVFYFDDTESKGKVVNGMNIFTYNDGSSGMARISAVTYEWISENRK
jgi:V8-like Glu-specific endopeptidase